MGFRAICDNCHRLVLGIFSSFTKIDGKYLCPRCAHDPTWIDHRLTFKQKVVIAWRWIRYGIAFLVALITFVFLLKVFGVFDPAPLMTCNDGWPSPSIGIMGACSHHGGVKRPENIKPLMCLFAFFLTYIAFLLMCSLLRISAIKANNTSPKE